MSIKVQQLFENIWQNYVKVTPSAKKIHQLLGDGKELINDHVAYRTFNINHVGIEKLAQHLLALGYEECGEYHFKAKKLYAKHFEHLDKSLPKVFISELLVEEFSEKVQNIIKNLVSDIKDDVINNQTFLYSGTHWKVSFADYQSLLQESEYAAWLAAWGYRANHFTVSINHLSQYECITEVNNALKSAGFKLNTAGGEIKGTKEVMLEQSSTLADKALVNFSDQSVEIPSCFYEFAKRYPMKNGELYSGFVAASADKIFESTNATT